MPSGRVQGRTGEAIREGGSIVSEVDGGIGGEMEIEEVPEVAGWRERGFIVRSGEKYFNLYVDAGRVSWTKYRSQAHRFATYERAENAITQIKKRNRMRREANKKSNEVR